MVFLPKERHEWINLRLQDFKSVMKYNFEMFRITSILTLCGETISDSDKLEKTFSTFHASNNRPTGAAPFPEVNEVHAHYSRRGKGRGSGHGRGRDSGRVRGRSRNNGQGRNYFPGVNHSSKKNYYQKVKKKDERHEVPEARDSENKCYRCGGSGHWSRTCQTPKHLVELYQASMKRKEKNPEANFISEDQVDITHLDVADFFEHPEVKIDHLIGDGSVVKED
ncbi:uncharacterized protein LOC132053778 [Lycium ferocissimum]|uniref:uncharacterized protein LOC132053778 n=1 Tax=Lycium ferocissimum TaxID=112874 RepID=UPI002815AB25|nr:uncharacterized protein LOC132053778 [Lycium ferocissimum]